MCALLVVAVVLVSFDDRVLGRAVHPLDLPICARDGWVSSAYARSRWPRRSC